MKLEILCDKPRIELYQGDCLEILPTFPDKSFDLVLTDPPYGHNNNNGDMISRWKAIFENKKDSYNVENDWRPILNDGKEANDLFKMAIKEEARLLKEGCCCCCCCCGGGSDPQFARWSLWLDEVIPFKMMVIWDKGKMGMGHHYRRSYETILIAQKGGSKCKWYAESKDIENIIRPNDYGIKKIIPTAEQHPTQKPVELASFFILLHTQVGDTILDPFAGSGTTGVAAYNLNRNCTMIELEPKYCDIIRKRFDVLVRQERIFA